MESLYTKTGQGCPVYVHQFFCNSSCDLMAAASRVRNDSVAASSNAWKELEKNFDSASRTIMNPIDDLIPIRI